MPSLPGGRPRPWPWALRPRPRPARRGSPRSWRSSPAPARRPSPGGPRPRRGPRACRPRPGRPAGGRRCCRPRRCRRCRSRRSRTPSASRACGRARPWRCGRGSPARRHASAAEPMALTMPSPTRAMIVSSVAPPMSWWRFARTVTRAFTLSWMPFLATASSVSCGAAAGRAVDHLGIDAGLHGLEHVAAGQVDGRGPLEVEVDDLGLVGGDHRANHQRHVAAGQVVGLQGLAGDAGLVLAEPGLHGHDLAADDDRRGSPCGTSCRAGRRCRCRRRWSPTGSTAGSTWRTPPASPGRR